MEGAGYLRSQAELCLQMAWAMSDPHAAVSLRAAAAEDFARALVVENQTATAEQIFSPRANQARKSVMARYFFRADFGGVSVTGDAGEEFSTLLEAELHAATVANEHRTPSRRVLWPCRATEHLARRAHRTAGTAADPVRAAAEAAASAVGVIQCVAPSSGVTDRCRRAVGRHVALPTPPQ